MRSAGGGAEGTDSHASEARPACLRRQSNRGRPGALQAVSTRRGFLAAWSRAAALCALAPLPFGQFGPAARAHGSRIAVRAGRVPSGQRFPFALGVASGEPAADGVVLWTRLLDLPGDPGGALPVRWEVAADDAFRRVVRSGEGAALAQLGHSVHVEVDGLEPDRDYWYRFHAAGATSPAGRTRTAPAPGIMPGRFDFVFVSCQHYERGWYTGFRHMAAESPALVVHLGDYIYESGPGEGDGLVRLHDTEEPRTLDGYRARYALYKRDPDLQAAHAAAPWVFTPDDHEVDNDWAGEHHTEEMSRGGVPRPPRRRLPGPVRALPPAADVAPRRPRRAVVPEARLRRPDAPPRPRHPPVPHPPALRRPAASALRRAARRRRHHPRKASRPTGSSTDSTGPPPATTSSPTRSSWPALLEGEEELTLPMDKWDGYPADRDRLMTFLHERRPANPVVLTGDLHTNWVNDLKLDFERADSPIVGAEFAGTSISSSGDGVDMAPQGGKRPRPQPPHQVLQRPARLRPLPPLPRAPPRPTSASCPTSPAPTHRSRPAPATSSKTESPGARET